MAACDQLTGRRAQTGNRRSHALNHSRRTWGLNLQKVKIPTGDGKMATVRISARTLRTLKKQGRL